MIGEVLFWGFNASWMCLLVCSIQWSKWGRVYRMTVPGSLERHHAARQRRIFRWPGFLYNAPSLGWWCWALTSSFGTWWTMLVAPLLLLMWSSARDDWRRLKRELAEDDEDPFNRGKRGLARAWGRAKAAASSLAPSPALPGAAGA